MFQNTNFNTGIACSTDFYFFFLWSGGVYMATRLRRNHFIFYINGHRLHHIPSALKYSNRFLAIVQVKIKTYAYKIF